MLVKRSPFRDRGFIIILFIAVLISSCGRRQRKQSPKGFSDETFAQKLEGILQPVDTTGGKHPVSIAQNVQYTYQLDDYEPLWLKQDYAPNDEAIKLIDALEDMRWDGFDPERYHIAAIRQLRIRLDTSRKKELNDAIVFDTLLTHSFLAASKDLLVGTIVPKDVDSLWYHVNDSVWNAPSMLANAKGTYPTLTDFRSQVPTYALLRDEYKRYYNLGNDSSFVNALGDVHYSKHPDSAEAAAINEIIKREMPWVETAPNDTITEDAQLMMAYQAYRGLKATGKPDSSTIADMVIPPAIRLEKIAANMERVRWMQRQFGDLYIVVDVPLMELFFRKDGVNAMHMRVAVGKPERQTPSLFAAMANVVINPPWGVPPTILKNDVLPGIQKSGKKYLAKKGLQAYDHNGKVVNAANITEKNYKRYTYKQDPGDDNSLGYVKFNLPNKWDIYLHDTPHRADFAKSYRAVSSGCIRLQQPQQMALYILGELEKKNYDQDRLDEMIQTHKTRWEILKNKIPVHVTYLTVFDDTTGKHIQFTRDIYHRDDKLISALNAVSKK